MKISNRTIYIVIGIALVSFLLGNPGSRRMFRRYWEIHKLKGMAELLKKENLLLRKEVYLLEKDQSYIERVARRELGRVSKGEVEYRFKK